MRRRFVFGIALGLLPVVLGGALFLLLPSAPVPNNLAPADDISLQPGATITRLTLALVNAPNDGERQDMVQSARARIDAVRPLAAGLEAAGGPEASAPDALLPALTRNIEEVNALTGRLLDAGRRQQELSARAGTLHATFSRSLEPQHTRWRSTLDRMRAELARTDQEEERRALLAQVMIKALENLEPLDQLERNAPNLLALLKQIPQTLEPPHLDVLELRSDLTVKALRKSLKEADPRLGALAGPVLDDLAAITLGPGGLVGLQREILALTGERAHRLEQIRTSAERLDQALAAHSEATRTWVAGLRRLVEPNTALLVLAMMGGLLSVSVLWRQVTLPRMTALDEESQGKAGLLQRIPPPLGLDVLALQMENHHVRVYTPLGNGRVMMRFRDALKGVADLDGLQVHRSYWVAAKAVEQVVRVGPNKFVLVLVNNLRIPVSRTHLDSIRAAGWVGRFTGGEAAGPG